MSVRVRDEDGQFVETITLERVLDLMRVADGPIVTAQAIAVGLGCSSEAVTKNLTQLQEQDCIES